eukprot:scaffold10723_cov164-Amphora_coffeaeformis.AAC.14
MMIPQRYSQEGDVMAVAGVELGVDRKSSSSNYRRLVSYLDGKQSKCQFLVVKRKKAKRAEG